MVQLRQCMTWLAIQRRHAPPLVSVPHASLFTFMLMVAGICRKHSWLICSILYYCACSLACAGCTISLANIGAHLCSALYKLVGSPNLRSGQGPISVCLSVHTITVSTMSVPFFAVRKRHCRGYMAHMHLFLSVQIILSSEIHWWAIHNY